MRELTELSSMLRQGQADFIVLDEILNNSDLEFRKIGEEENVLVESVKGTGRKNTFLDYDSMDKTTQRFFEIQDKKISSKFQRSYLDDVYEILDSVSLGWGRAVLPKHLIEQHSDIRILTKYKTLKSPILLCFYKQPYYSELFNQVLECFQ